MREIGYHQITKGDVYTGSCIVSSDMAKAYASFVGAEEPYDVVDPWVFCSFTPWYRALGGRPEQGTVHLRQRTELYGRTRVGEALQVEVRVAEKGIRKDRPYVRLETLYKDNGRVRCSSTATFLWGYAQR